MKALNYIFLIAITFFALTSCMEVKEEFSVNKEGNGKVEIEASMILGGNMLSDNNSNKKDTVTDKDRERMTKKVKKIINKSQGIEAWDNLEYKIVQSEEKGKRMKFRGTAYFRDITGLSLNVIPNIKVSEFSKDGMVWNTGSKDDDESKGLSISKEPGESDSNLTKEEIKKHVEKLRETYKQKKMIMSMALSRFEMETTYKLPYKIKKVQGAGLEKVDDRTVKMDLDGNMLFNRFDALMDKEEEIKKLVRKGVREFDYDDTRIKKAAYSGKNQLKVTFRTGLFAPGPKEYFNYSETVKNIKNKKPEFN